MKELGRQFVAHLYTQVVKPKGKVNTHQPRFNGNFRILLDHSSPTVCVTWMSLITRVIVDTWLRARLYKSLGAFAVRGRGLGSHSPVVPSRYEQAEIPF